MSLPVPVVGSELGPAYAVDINNCMALIAQHNHSAGQGNPIGPSGLNINASLTLNSNPLVAIQYAAFTAQPSALPGSVPTIGAVYVAGVDLFYNDLNGNQIQITSGGSVTGATGTITGLPSGTAGAAYSSGSAAFIFTSATNTPANLDGASVTVRNLAASGKGVIVQAPGAVAADYPLVLPTLPAAQSFMTLDNSGNMAAPWTVDNSSIEVASNLVQLKNQGTTQSKLALRTTGTTVAAGGIAVSAAVTSYSNSSVTPTTVASVTITTLGRPVAIFLQPVPGSTVSSIEIDAVGGQSGNGFFSLNTAAGSSVPFRLLTLVPSTASPQIAVPPGAVYFVDLAPAGTYTYTLTGRIQSTGTPSTLFATNVQLVAYEL